MPRSFRSLPHGYPIYANLQLQPEAAIQNVWYSFSWVQDSLVIFFCHRIWPLATYFRGRR
jgi:hypothetical protein